MYSFALNYYTCGFYNTVWFVPSDGLILAHNFKQTTGTRFSIHNCEVCHKGFTGFMKHALKCVGKLHNKSFLNTHNKTCTVHSKVYFVQLYTTYSNHSELPVHVYCYLEHTTQLSSLRRVGIATRHSLPLHGRIVHHHCLNYSPVRNLACGGHIQMLSDSSRLLFASVIIAVVFSDPICWAFKSRWYH